MKTKMKITTEFGAEAKTETQKKKETQKKTGTESLEGSEEETNTKINPKRKILFHQAL